MWSEDMLLYIYAIKFQMINLTQPDNDHALFSLSSTKHGDNFEKAIVRQCSRAA